MELILTLDVGTTSVKACLFDRQLRQTALTSREYALQTRGVCAEAEAQVYLDAAAQCILSLPARSAGEGLRGRADDAGRNAALRGQAGKGPAARDRLAGQPGGGAGGAACRPRLTGSAFTSAPACRS